MKNSKNNNIILGLGFWFYLLVSVYPNNRTYNWKIT